MARFRLKFRTALIHLLDKTQLRAPGLPHKCGVPIATDFLQVGGTGKMRPAENHKPHYYAPQEEHGPRCYHHQ
jgi:hypothetical protein